MGVLCILWMPLILRILLLFFAIVAGISFKFNKARIRGVIGHGLLGNVLTY